MGARMDTGTHSPRINPCLRVSGTPDWTGDHGVPVLSPSHQWSRDSHTLSLTQWCALAVISFDLSILLGTHPAV